MSNSSRPCGLQHARIPCPLPISLSFTKFSSIESMMPSNHLMLCHPLLLLASIFCSIMSFPVNRLFTSGGQSIGTSPSTSVLLVSIQGWFPLGFTGLISLLSKGLSRVFSSTTVWKHQFFSVLPSLWTSCHSLDHKKCLIQIFQWVKKVNEYKLFIKRQILEKNAMGYMQWVALWNEISVIYLSQGYKPIGLWTITYIWMDTTCPFSVFFKSCF